MERGVDNVVLLCDSAIRLALSSLLSRQIPQLSVLAYDEIVIGTQVESASTVLLEKVIPSGREAMLVR
jgi:flagellar biosynthesis component FlhA